MSDDWFEGLMRVEYREIHRTVTIPTRYGKVTARAGDYLVRDTEDRVWPVRGEVFDRICEVLE